MTAHLSAKNRILEAYQILLQKQVVEDISVKNILELAHVSRPTFYHYFTDKYDL